VNDTREALRAQVDGILENIFAADESYNLAFCIGRRADDLNKHGYGAAFRPVQNMLEQHFVLSVTKLFEEANPRYPTRSIPAALRILKKQAGKIQIQERAAMLLRFSRIGIDTSCFHALADEELMLATIAHYETRLPSTAVLSDLAPARTLKALSFRRNKVIAHNEDTSALSFPHTTWGEARLLVELAKNFVDVIGAGCLSYILSGDDGVFLPSEDAKRSAKSLERIFTTLLASG
jgi:AbiU2